MAAACKHVQGRIIMRGSTGVVAWEGHVQMEKRLGLGAVSTVDDRAGYSERTLDRVEARGDDAHHEEHGREGVPLGRAVAHYVRLRRNGGEGVSGAPTWRGINVVTK